MRNEKVVPEARETANQTQRGLNMDNDTAKTIKDNTFPQTSPISGMPIPSAASNSFGSNLSKVFDPNAVMIPPTDLKPRKPGWTTSEFWLAIATQVASLLVLFGVIEPGQQANINNATAEVIESIFAIVGATAPAVAYIMGRAKVKSRPWMEL